MYICMYVCIYVNNILTDEVITFLRVILEDHCNVAAQTECGNWQVLLLLDQGVPDQDTPMSTLRYSIT